MKISLNLNTNFKTGYTPNVNLNQINHNEIPNTGSTQYEWKNLFGKEKIYDPKRNVICINQKRVKDGPITILYAAGRITKVNSGWGGKGIVIEETNVKSAKNFEKEKGKL